MSPEWTKHGEGKHFPSLCLNHKTHTMYQVLVIADELYHSTLICTTDNLEIAESYLKAFAKVNPEIANRMAIYDKRDAIFYQYDF